MAFSTQAPPTLPALFQRQLPPGLVVCLRPGGFSLGPTPPRGGQSQRHAVLTDKVSGLLTQ